MQFGSDKRMYWKTMHDAFKHGKKCEETQKAHTTMSLQELELMQLLETAGPILDLAELEAQIAVPATQLLAQSQTTPLPLSSQFQEQ